MSDPGLWPEIRKSYLCLITASMPRGRFPFIKRIGPGSFRKMAGYRKSSGEFLSSFPKAYVFSAHRPEIWIRGLNRAGVKKIGWIPSFPDIQQGFKLQSLQRKILDSENIPWLAPEKTVFPITEDLQKARAYLFKHLRLEEARPLWAIHPGSGSPHKNWPLARFLETARKTERPPANSTDFLIRSSGTGNRFYFDLGDSNPGVPNRQEYILADSGRCVVLLPRVSGQ